MKYNFEKYTTELTEEGFRLPDEFVDSVGDEIYYIFWPSDGLAIIGDVEFGETLANNVFNSPHEKSIAAQRFVYSRLIRTQGLDDIVSCLTGERIGFEYGEKVTVESGRLGIKVKKAE